MGRIRILEACILAVAEVEWVLHVKNLTGNPGFTQEEIKFIVHI